MEREALKFVKIFYFIIGSMKLEVRILNNSYLDFFKIRTNKSNYTAKKDVSINYPMPEFNPKKSIVPKKNWTKKFCCEY